MKNYRYLGEEADLLGKRLDAARSALARSQNSWARNYWNSAVERLLFHWHQLPILHDAEACMSVIPRWTIDYNYYETGHNNEGFSITDRVFYKLVKENSDLTASWERNRERRLARAQ